MTSTFKRLNRAICAALKILTGIFSRTVQDRELVFTEVK